MSLFISQVKSELEKNFKNLNFMKNRTTELKEAYNIRKDSYIKAEELKKSGKTEN